MGSRFGEDIYGADAYGESGEGPFRLDFNRLTGELTFIELIDGEWTPRGVVNVAGLLGGPTGPTGPAGPTGAQGPTGRRARRVRGERRGLRARMRTLTSSMGNTQASSTEAKKSGIPWARAESPPSKTDGRTILANWSDSGGSNGIVYLTGRAAGDTQSYIIFTLPWGTDQHKLPISCAARVTVRKQRSYGLIRMVMFPSRLAILSQCLAECVFPRHNNQLPRRA